MFETNTTNKVEHAEIIKSTEPFHELAEAQLALIGGGSGIALCE
ncbi:MAG TPA: hypothetical protein VFE23_15190 [Usitatibacter sp.]|jgi:hypothetical protein|nr:hypothetical protein [Usitatibacter sp.]